jgi:competence protein ComEC
VTEVGSTLEAGGTPEDRLSRLPSPALFLALAFALGVGIIGEGAASPHERFRLVPALIVAGALSLLAGAILLRLERDRLAVPATLTGLILAGAAAALLFAFRFPPDHVSHLKNWGVDVGRPVSLEGSLGTDCIITPTGCEFDLEVTALRVGPGELQTQPASGRIRVQVAAARATASSAGTAFELRSGDRVQATMRLHQPHVALNPGSFDFRERAANIDDLYWEGAVEDPAQLHRLSNGRAPAAGRVIESVRARLRRAIELLYPPWSAEGRDGAVLKAILLGDRTALDSATVDHFRVTGLYHLLVIAGLHVGLIAALVLGLLRLLGLNRRWRNSALLIILLAYALVVEQRAPTLRATLMLVIFILAQFLGRDHSALNSVGLAALALLVTRPAWLFESGFQLSFAAALLIVGLAAPILRLSLQPYRNALGHLDDVERDAAFTPRQAQFRLDLRMLVSVLQRSSALLNRHPALARRLVVWPPRLALWAAGMVMFSAILQVGLLLPMVQQFHRVTLAGVGLNALALPLMGVLLAVAIPTVLLAIVASSAAAWPAKLLTVVFHALFAIAEWPHLPTWLSYRVPPPPVWVAVGFAVSLVALAVSLGRHSLASGASLLAFAIFALTLAFAPFAPAVQSGAFEVTALDCGGGEAAFLALPDRSTVLIGAGGTGRGRPEFTAAKRWDPGENIVSPYLWSRRIKSLDVVVVTSVAGNVDGFLSILGNFRVGELWFRESDAGLASILEEAGRRGVRIRAMSPGDILRLGATVFEILAPPAPAPGAAVAATPLIIRVTTGDATALVAGSASIHTQQRILESGSKARSLILANGHQTLVWAFGRKVPLAAGIPVANRGPEAGVREDYNLTSLPALGNRVFATDRDGAITVEMKGGALRIWGFRESALRDLTDVAAAAKP